jgi:CDP-glucose 4,6-dehydratase
MIETPFWKGKRVFVTGHTGFKGAWLSLWLHLLGAKVTGYALAPPTKPSLFEDCRIGNLVTSVIADIRDSERLRGAMKSAAPELVIHMAAQALVRESYRNPAETYEVNVMGTVNLLESVRSLAEVRAVLVVTSDKCYENKEWVWGYRENDPMGGYDPYSSSKGCAELVTSAYLNSFFNPADYAAHGVGLASARAGNCIGGGDWAPDRLIPDCVRALLKGEPIRIRSPRAVRPWQHVLEPLGGYLMLAQELYRHGSTYAGGWNFGPDDREARSVEWIVRKVCQKWGNGAIHEVEAGPRDHEAHYLKLDCSKARAQLGWHPRWGLETALDRIVEWTRGYARDRDSAAMCLRQIHEYALSEGEA